MNPMVVRSSERVSTALSAIVKFKENKDDFWKETAKTLSVSRNGAGFFLERNCKVGHLLSLIIPMPQDLRCYDEDKELYRIWGIVQHCHEVETEKFSGFHVGVAFIGKNAPAGYKEDPGQSFKICGMNENGLWKVVATGRPFVKRKNPRFWTMMEVDLELLDEEGEDLSREKTMTENISICGAAVFSNLNLQVDDCIQFTSKAHDFSALAVVRDIQETEHRPKVHLEFVNAKFPIEKLILHIEEEEKN